MRPLIEPSLWRALATALLAHGLILAIAALRPEPAALRGIAVDTFDLRFHGYVLYDGFYSKCDEACPAPPFRLGDRHYVVHPWTLPVEATPYGPLDRFIYRHLELDPARQRRCCRL